MEIAESYNFSLPKLSKGSKNFHIKILCEMAGITYPVELVRYSGAKKLLETKAKNEIISTHTARRSFARKWIDGGGNVAVLSKIIGHTTEAQTLKYVGYEFKETEQAIKNIFD